MIETKNPEELVQAQLEEWAKTDAALAEKFNPEKVGSCWRWIIEKAREALHGESGAIWHEQVFRWARDYFVDGVAGEEAAPKRRRKEKQHVVEAATTPHQSDPTTIAAPQASKPAPGLQQLDLFGGLG